MLASGSRYQPPHSEVISWLDTETSTEYDNTPGTESDVNLGTKPKHSAPWILLETEDQETMPVRESSSSSPDEAVLGSSLALVMEDSRAHQELFCRVAQNLGFQMEEVSKGVDPMTDILALSGPARVALPLVKTIQNTTKALWQTPVSLPPTAKKVERKYFVPSKDHEYLYTHPPPGSPVIAVANQCERQGPMPG